MRNAFAAEITEQAGKHKDLFLLSGDIGNRLFDGYKKNYSDRFLNCGVAEANMISMAAGMAMSGLKPVTYTINSFMTTRCYEQIRIDVCYHNVPVIIVGVGAGLGYASLGATHHSCEDIAALRVLPNMKVVCPGDPVEVKLALAEALKEKGPVFLRLGKKGEPVVHAKPPSFKIGKGIIVGEGKDVCIFSTGATLPLAMETAERLSKEKLSARVVSLHTVKPLDEVLLKDAFSKFSLVATIEEHSRLGGLGSAVAEWKTDQISLNTPLARFGTSDTFLHGALSLKSAREQFDLTPDAMVKKMLNILRRK